jgi:hypothetical protein
MGNRGLTGGVIDGQHHGFLARCVGQFMFLPQENR